MNDKLKNIYTGYSAARGMALSTAAKQRVKDKVFQRLSEPLPETAAVSWRQRLAGLTRHRYAVTVIVVVLFVVSTGIASAHALPGDLLYPVKLQVESAQVLLAPTADAKLKLQVNFAEKRLDELEKVQAAALPPTATAPTQKKAPEAEASHQSKHQTPSEVQAQAGAEQALNSLIQIKQHLDQHGDNQQVEGLDKTIDNFRKKLNQDKRIEIEGHSHGGDEGGDSH